MAPVRKGPKLNYTEDQISLVIRAIKNGMGMRQACQKFSVPKSTVLDKVKGRTPMKRKMGRDPYLKEEEEMAIVNWIKRCLRRGFPPHYHVILNSA